MARGGDRDEHSGPKRQLDEKKGGTETEADERKDRQRPRALVDEHCGEQGQPGEGQHDTRA